MISGRGGDQCSKHVRYLHEFVQKMSDSQYEEHPVRSHKCIELGKCEKELNTIRKTAPLSKIQTSNVTDINTLATHENLAVTFLSMDL